jgi:hypothetical protein
MLLYVTLVFGIITGGFVTPQWAQLIKGQRHARKLGHPKLPAWSDPAPNWPVVLAVVALLLVLVKLSVVLPLMLITSSGDLIAGTLHNFSTGLGAGLATAVFTVLYFCFGMQFFALRFPKNGMSLFALTIFLLWVVPLLLGMGLAIADTGHGSSTYSSMYALSLCPFSGIALAMSTDFIPTYASTACAYIVVIAAAVPAAVFTVLSMIAIDSTVSEA